MSSVDFGEIEVRGQKFRVQVTESGVFTSANGSKTISSSTLDGLKNQLSDVVRRAAVDISVPFTILPTDRGQAKRAIAKGRHGGNGNILFLAVGDHWTPKELGRTQQWTSMYSTITAGELTTAEIETFYRLRNAAREANHALHAFTGRVQIELGKAVDEAVTAATMAVEETDG